jgi:membrane protein
VYLSWLILLIGAQLAFYLQFPQYLRHGQRPIELNGRDREQIGLSIMYLIGRDYAAGRSFWSVQSLADELDVPSILAAPMVRCLEEAGLIVATERQQYVPSRSLELIQLADIFDSARALHTGKLAVGIRIVAPAAALFKQRSLRDLIKPKD